MIRHANEKEPFECCGLVAVDRGRVVAVYPTRTELGTASAVRYTIDPRDLLKLLPVIEDNGHQLGIFHSHTHSEAYPSPTDVENAARYPGAYHFIVSLQNRSVPEIRVFLIEGEEIAEESIVSEADSPNGSHESRVTGHESYPAPDARLGTSDARLDRDVPARERLMLPETQRQAMIDHALREAPNECCGLLKIDQGRIVEVFPTANELASPVRYQIPPQDIFEIGCRTIGEGGFDLGIFHSHLTSEAYPSRTDQRLAMYPLAYYVILSLRDPADPAIRAFRIQFADPDGPREVVEVDLIVESDAGGSR